MIVLLKFGHLLIPQRTLIWSTCHECIRVSLLENDPLLSSIDLGFVMMGALSLESRLIFHTRPFPIPIIATHVNRFLSAHQFLSFIRNSFDQLSKVGIDIYVLFEVKIVLLNLVRRRDSLQIQIPVLLIQEEKLYLKY